MCGMIEKEPPATAMSSLAAGTKLLSMVSTAVGKLSALTSQSGGKVVDAKLGKLQEGLKGMVASLRTALDAAAPDAFKTCLADENQSTESKVSWVKDNIYPAGSKIDSLAACLGVLLKRPEVPSPLGGDASLHEIRTALKDYIYFSSLTQANFCTGSGFHRLCCQDHRLRSVF